MGLLLLYERLIIGIANRRSTVYNHPMNTISVDAGKSVRAEIESAIFAHIDERIERSGSMSGDYKRLWTEIRALMGSGGKRIRSRIVVLSYQMFGGDDVRSIVPVAAAHELLHLGVLIHDDIIDRDYVRYGVENIAGKYQSIYADVVQDTAHRLHYSHSAAILAGDLMLSDAYQMIAAANIEPARVIEVQKIFGEGVFEVIGGELLDTEAAFLGDSGSSALLVALHKTASYTFILPMLVGACLADATTDQRLGVIDFAKNLGIAFQLRDDVLGVFGDEAETGKTSTGDIREGKRTYMIERFYEVANRSQRSEFESLFGDEQLSDTGADRVRELLIDSGSLDKTEQAIASYTQAARRCLEVLDINPAFADEVDNLIVLATDRKK